MKIIKLAEDETFDDLVIEIEVLSRCHHPNIVGYFGCWRKKDELFIAMEYCDGGSTADIYETLDSGLAEEEIKVICRESLKGLAYMHSLGFLHRDIKGANILVKRDGSVKLIDFGVSGKVSAASPTRRTFIGTPYWMAPEVIENKITATPYGAKADVWSLGITLIELAHGDPPLSELHPMKALFQIPYRNPPTLGDASKWSPEFEDFVSRSLVKRPDERWTVDQLLQHPWLQSCPEQQTLVCLVEDYLEAKARLDAEDAQEPMEAQTEEERQAEALLETLERSGKLDLDLPAVDVKAIEANIPTNDESAGVAPDNSTSSSTSSHADERAAEQDSNAPGKHAKSRSQDKKDNRAPGGSSTGSSGGAAVTGTTRSGCSNNDATAGHHERKPSKKDSMKKDGSSVSKKESMKREKKEEREREKAAALAAKREKQATAKREKEREKEEKERKKSSAKAAAAASKRDRRASETGPGDTPLTPVEPAQGVVTTAVAPAVPTAEQAAATDKKKSLKEKRHWANGSNASACSETASPGTPRRERGDSESLAAQATPALAEDASVKDKRRHKHEHKKTETVSSDGTSKRKHRHKSSSSRAKDSEEGAGEDGAPSVATTTVTQTDTGSVADATAAEPAPIPADAAHEHTAPSTPTEPLGAATATTTLPETTTTTATATAVATTAATEGVSEPSLGAPVGDLPQRPTNEPTNRPRTVHHATARRTAEIQQNINRRLLRRQLAEIKALTKQHQRDYDLLESRQAEQKAKIHKFWADRLSADQTKRGREDEKITRRVGLEREAEARRFRADVEALTRQQQGLLKAWARDFGQQQRALQHVFEEQVAQRAKEFKDADKAKEKESRTVPKKLREQQKVDRRQEYADGEEELALLFRQQLELARVFDENLEQLALLDEANALLAEQKKQHFVVEYATLAAAHKRQMDALESELALTRDALVHTHEYDEEAMKQTQFLAKEQLARRFLLETQQQERQQAFEQRDGAKEIRQRQKKKLDAFVAQQKEALRASSGDKKAAMAMKDTQRSARDAYARELQAEEARENEAIKKRQDDDDENLRKSHEEQSAALTEMHEAQRVDLQTRYEQAQERLARDAQRRVEELRLRQCKEVVTLMRQEQIEMGGVVRETIRAHFCMRSESQKREADQLTAQLQAYKVLVVTHQRRHRDLLKQRHALQLQLWEKEKRRTVDRGVLERQQAHELQQQERVLGLAVQRVEDAIRSRREMLERTHEQQTADDAERAAHTRARLARLLDASYTRHTEHIAAVLQHNTLVANTLATPKPIVPGTPYD